MNSVFSLLLLASLSAMVGVEVAAKGAPREQKKIVAKPAWAKDIPSTNPYEAGLELQRRIALGQVVRARAVIKVFLPIALSSFSLNGTDDIHVAGTKVKIVYPKRFEGLDLLIHHNKMPGEDSCWRKPDCEVEFDLYQRLLETLQAGMDTWFIYDSDLKNIAFARPAIREKAKPPIHEDPNR
jgi:hypothetical protein